MSVWISLFVLQLITGMASSMGFLYDSTQHTHYASGHGISLGVPIGHRTAHKGYGISRRVATGHRTAQSGYGIIRGVATTAPSTRRAWHLPQDIAQHTASMASPKGVPTRQH